MKKNTKQIEQIIVDSLNNTDDSKEWNPEWIKSSFNVISGRCYSLLNTMILHDSMSDKGLNSKRWLTFNQAKHNGWHVKKGSKATPILSSFFIQDKKDKDRKHFGMKRIFLFNEDQVEGIPPLPIKTKKSDINFPLLNNVMKDLNLQFAESSKTKISEAAYNHKEDKLYMPQIDLVNSPEGYYSVFFHELIHSTMHADRLNRNLNYWKDQNIRGKEELVAEIGSMYLLEHMDIKHDRQNSLSYLNVWKKAIKSDPNYLTTVLKDANQAVDYVLKTPSMKVYIEELEKSRSVGVSYDQSNKKESQKDDVTSQVFVQQ